MLTVLSSMIFLEKGDTISVATLSVRLDNGTIWTCALGICNVDHTFERKMHQNRILLFSNLMNDMIALLEFILRQAGASVVPTLLQVACITTYVFSLALTAILMLLWTA